MTNKCRHTPGSSNPRESRLTGGYTLSLVAPPGPECPYCHTPVTDATAKQYVNGIKPLSGRGCEFCNPSKG